MCVKVITGAKLQNGIGTANCFGIYFRFWTKKMGVDTISQNY
jgi:hypothetical protein